MLVLRRLTSLIMLLSLTPALAVEVTTSDDELHTPSGASVSLREALRDTHPGGTITFAPALSGATLALELGALVISKDLTLDASGLIGSLEISGEEVSGILTVNSTVSLTLRNLSLVNGRSSGGGAVSLAAGTTFVAESCRFADNQSTGSGGAIHLFDIGEIRLDQCLFEGNRAASAGAAVYASGFDQTRTLVFKNSRFMRNSSPNGGAISIGASDFVIDRCLFSQNKSSTGGGALFLGLGTRGTLANSTFSDNWSVRGGALSSAGEEVTVTNTTFSGNFATEGGGSISVPRGALTLEHVTIVGNAALGPGGGLSAEAAVLVKNSIIAENRSPVAGSMDLADASSFLTRSGNNLIGDPGTLTALFPPGLPNASGDYVGSSGLPLPALLAPLGDFGGPLPSRPPLSGSLAVDRSVFGPTHDQRGVTRPQGLAADIGAVERTASDPSIDPPAGSSLVSRLPTLAWPPVPGATRYRLHLGTDPSPAALVETAALFHKLDLLLAATPYYWKVVALTPEGEVEVAASAFVTRPDLLVTSADDDIDPDDGVITLREAVASAANLPGWDRITFSPTLSGSTIIVAGGPLIISNQSLLIDASGLDAPPALSGGGASRILSIEFLSEVEAVGLRFVDSLSSPSEGAVTVFQHSRFKASGCSFSGHSETAFTALDAEVEFAHCVFSGNGTGCRFSRTGEVKVTGCTFTGNTTGMTADSQVTCRISDSGFDGNSQGLGVSGPSVIESCSFRGHSGTALIPARLSGPVRIQVMDCTFEDNSGTAIYIPYALPVHISACTFTRNQSRAIYGPCVVEGSIFVGNSVENIYGGAAIHSPRTDATEISGCYFQGNSTSGRGGAVTLNGGSIINCTFIDNLAAIGGAISTEAGKVTLQNLTIVRNRAIQSGGGVLLDAETLELGGCLIAENEAPTGPDAYRRGGAFPSVPTVTRHGPNLVRDNRSVSGLFPAPDSPGIPNANGDLVGTPGQPLDPLLSPVGDFGGTAPVLLPLAGSPALDKIDPASAPLFDQRGIARPQGGMADIGAAELEPGTEAYFPTASAVGVPQNTTLSWVAGGAAGPFIVLLGTAPDALAEAGTSPVGSLEFELEPSTTYYWQVHPVAGPPGPLLSFSTRANLVVTTALDTANGSDGLISLREAINAARAAPGYDRIAFDPSLEGRTSTLTTPLVVTDPALEIDASSLTSPITLSGGRAVRLFDIQRSSGLHLTHVVISGGAADKGAAAILSESSLLTLTDCEVTGHTATLNGGALWISGNSAVHAIRTRFAMNSAQQGAAVFIHEENERTRFESCRFEKNQSSWNGGAIAVDSASFGAGGITRLEFVNTRFSENASAQHGGALWMEELTDLLIDECHFDSNTAAGGGGAIFVTDSWTFDDRKPSAALANTTFSANAANASGGGLSLSGALVTATNTTFSGNSGRLGGGAILLSSGSLTLDFSTIYGNSGGAGISISNITASLTLRGTIIASNGGGRDINASYASNLANGGHNFIGNNSSVETAFPLSSGPSLPNASGDFVGSPQAPLDPLLQPLADHGGSAPIHLLLSGAPQRDRISSSAPNRDQRGISRPQGTATDIGAVEAAVSDPDFFSPPSGSADHTTGGVELLWSFANDADTYQVLFGTDPGSLEVVGASATGRFTTGPLEWHTNYYWRIDAVTPGGVIAGPVLSLSTRTRIIVNTASSQVNAGDGLTSLPEAILLAAAAPGLDEIIFDPALAGKSITLSSSQVIASQQVTIHGGGLSPRLSIASSVGTQALDISASTATFKHLDFTSGGAAFGSAIRAAAQSVLRLEDCTFAGLPKTAVVLANSNLTAISCRFSGNGSATSQGGAISGNGGTLEISSTGFTGNFAATGGAVHFGAASGSYVDCTFANNRSVTGPGGAMVAATGSSVTISRSTWIGNVASGANAHGGAIAFSGTQLAADRVSFVGNRASGNGGAFATSTGGFGVSFANGTFANNTSGASGGAAFAPQATFFHTTITGNQSTSSGGGLSSDPILIHSIVAGNSSATGNDIHSSATLSASNLIGSNDSLSGFSVRTGSPNSSGQFVGSVAEPLDPRLSPLATYGFLLCRPPLPGSVAINNARPYSTSHAFLVAAASMDQAGHARPFGPAPDLGAVEARPFSDFGLVDTDGDAIDDRIEPALGLIVGIDERGHDLDGDGQTDADELNAMTDLFNPADRLAILSITPGANFDPVGNPRLSVTWLSAPGMSYRALSSPDLSGFEPVTGANASATAKETSLEILLPAGHRFLRIESTP